MELKTPYQSLYLTNYLEDFPPNSSELEDDYSLFENWQTEQPQHKLLNALEGRYKLLPAKKLQNLVHFQQAVHTPVQRWFGYREGYSIELVHTFIREFGITRNILDPFSGSGTTLLSARLNGLQSFGIEINPLSVLVAKCENVAYAAIDIENLKHTLSFFYELEKDGTERTTLFELAQTVFNKEILQTLLQLKEWIYNIENEKVKNLFFMTWLSIIEGVSNIKKEGNGIKYKYRKRTPNGYVTLKKEEWEKVTFPADKFVFVKNRMINQLKNILFDIENKYGASDKQPIIIQGNCLELDTFITDNIQLTFYSPPYCNCFDYFEIHKVELWLGDFVKSREDMRNVA